MPPVIPTPEGTDHVYKVPEGITPLVTSTGVTLNVTPLQLIPVIVLMAAFGLIVTVNVNGLPAPQFTVIGVTV